MVDEAGACFSGAPSSSKQAIEIGPKHGAGVIEREEGVKSDLLELALPGHASTLSLHALVRALWKVTLNIRRVVGVFVREEARVGSDD